MSRECGTFRKPAPSLCSESQWVIHLSIYRLLCVSAVALCTSARNDGQPAAGVGYVFLPLACEFLPNGQIHFTSWFSSLGTDVCHLTAATCRTGGWGSARSTPFTHGSFRTCIPVVLRARKVTPTPYLPTSTSAHSCLASVVRRIPHGRYLSPSAKGCCAFLMMTSE